MNSKLNHAVAICDPLELEHPDSFLDVQVPYPKALPHDVIVRVEAVSINPADMRARLRKQKDNRINVLGWDVAGTIVEKGNDKQIKWTSFDADGSIWLDLELSFSDVITKNASEESASIKNTLIEILHQIGRAHV